MDDIRIVPTAQEHIEGLQRREVFASNTRAIALYAKLGFVREGMKRRARKLDGVYDDVVLMASVA